MKIRGVYSILNSNTSKQYIGSSKDVMRRLGEHKSSLRKNNHYCEELQKDWKESLEFGFTAKLLESVPEEINLFERERYYIESNTNLYNTHSPSDNGGSTFQPEETRKKIKIKTNEAMKKDPLKFKEARDRSSVTIKRMITENNNTIGIAKKVKVVLYNEKEFLRFNSIKEAAAFINVTAPRITECLVGFKHKEKGVKRKVNSIKGYKCKYLEN